MKSSSSSKTLTASLSESAQAVFTRICDPMLLPNQKYKRARTVRNDHALLIDVVFAIDGSTELTHAVRVLGNGDGCEVIWTLVKPAGVAESAFHEHTRWAGNALHQLRKPAPVSTLENQDNESATSATVPSLPLTGKKLFVGNLPYTWTDDQLRIYFLEQGTVATAEVAKFRGRGGERSRGFGFVEMGSEDEAQNAIQKLHGVEAGGRAIIVRLAKSQESRPSKPSAEAQPVSTELQPENSDKPEIGNERFPSRPPTRSPRPDRTRPGRRPRHTKAHPNRRTDSHYPNQSPQDITNSSGYEIFPRRRRA